MPLANDEAPKREGLAIVAMAFRDDHSAERITISNLSFEGCNFASSAEFAIGERVRLHIRGQGWIESRVMSVSAGLTEVLFVTQCAV